MSSNESLVCAAYDVQCACATFKEWLGGEAAWYRIKRFGDSSFTTRLAELVLHCHWTDMIDKLPKPIPIKVMEAMLALSSPGI